MNDSIFDEAFLKKLERLTILSRRAISGKLQGERRSLKRGRSIEFSDFRPYASGDDFRRIDWNAYARLERFFIKLFVEEEDLTVHFLVDCSRSMDWGKPNKHRYAIQISAALGYITMVGLDRATVTALGNVPARPGQFFAPKRGRQHVLHLFSFLESLIPDGKDSGQHMAEYSIQAYPVGAAVVISDLMDDGWMNGISQLAGRGFETIVIHTLSPDEVDPGQNQESPLQGDFKLIDLEKNSEVEITADFETIDRYRRHLLEWRRMLKKFCSSRGVHYIPVETSVSIEDLIFSWMKVQGVVK